jgi:hypothetical protein
MLARRSHKPRTPAPPPVQAPPHRARAAPPAMRHAPCDRTAYIATAAAQRPAVGTSGTALSRSPVREGRAGCAQPPQASASLRRGARAARCGWGWDGMRAAGWPSQYRWAKRSPAVPTMRRCAPIGCSCAVCASRPSRAPCRGAYGMGESPWPQRPKDSARPKARRRRASELRELISPRGGGLGGDCTAQATRAGACARMHSRMHGRNCTRMCACMNRAHAHVD